MKKIVFGICLLALVFNCKTKVGDTKTNNSQKGQLPNLVIVLSDQHSYDMVGAYGNKQIQEG